MRVRTRVVLLVVIVVAGIALAVWTQVRPLIDAGQASSIALDIQAGPDHTGWRVDSATLDYNGNRPRVNLPGFRDSPKCWGASLPVGDGYCLPYPVWHVHLVGTVPAGQCSDVIDFVDARKARVAVSLGGSGSCG